MSIIDDLERKLDQLLIKPDNAELYNEVGVLLYRLKDWENAYKYIHKAYELCPTKDDTLYNYASILYQQSQWKKAIPIFQTYLEIYPANREVVEKLGDSFYLLGEYDSATKMYEQLPKVQKGEA